MVRAAPSNYRAAQMDYYNVSDLNIFMAHALSGTVNIYYKHTTANQSLIN